MNYNIIENNLPTELKKLIFEYFNAKYYVITNIIGITNYRERRIINKLLEEKYIFESTLKEIKNIDYLLLSKNILISTEEYKEYPFTKNKNIKIDNNILKKLKIALIYNHIDEMLKSISYCKYKKEFINLHHFNFNELMEFMKNENSIKRDKDYKKYIKSELNKLLA